MKRDETVTLERDVGARRAESPFIDLSTDIGANEPAVEDLTREVVRRLLDAPSAQVVAPIGVVVLSALLLMGSVPGQALSTWTGVVTLATALRLYLPRRIRQVGLSGNRALLHFRLGVLYSALAWGSGPLLILRGASIEQMAIVSMVFAGIVAAATSTFVGDRVSFHVFTVVVLSPLGLTMLVQWERQYILMTGLVAFYGVMASVMHKHSSDRLLDLLRTGWRLRQSDRRTTREKAFLDALFRCAPVAIVAIAERNRVLAVNPAFESLFGYSRAEARDRSINELIVPATLQDEAQDIDEALANTGTVTFETRRRHRNGRVIDVRIAGSLASGEAAGVGFVVYDDITDRKRAENELREHEAQYRLMVESMSDLVWRTDAEGHWTFLNQATREMFGVAPEQMLGRSVLEFSAPERREADAGILSRLLAGDVVFDAETVSVRADGTRVHLSFSARPVRDSESRVIGAQGTARDVTARARIHAELARARQEAERTAAARSAFVANVSHEIRTPMNGIIGITDLMLDSNLKVEQRRSIELIRTSAESLLSVINDILDYSKIEAGRLTVDQETFDLHGLIDSAVRLMAGAAGDKGIELRHVIETGVPRMVSSDPARVRQVLNNLLSNAVKFTEQGGVVVTARCMSADDSGVMVGIVVRDTGIGIEAEKLSTIFEEFSQVDMTTTRRFGGTGLGLAIARRLTRLLGGDLVVASQPGRGSEFTATLKVQEAENVHAPNSTTGAGLAGRRALVVDDNRTNCRIFRDMLRAAGMQVAVARSAESGLGMLRRSIAAGRSVDMALIDSLMPGMDGFEMAGELRTDHAFDATQILLLTSGGTPGDAQRCRDLGIDAYLTKPFSRAELLEAIAAALGEGRSRRGRQLITRHSIEETRRRLSILLVEDNAVNREVASTMLKRRGHAVDIATNGREAVDAVKDRMFDLVLMDIQMPVLDGLAATREIRALAERDGLRIVALTAHALATEKRRCLAAGMDGYLSKPFRPYELFAMIEGWGSPGETEAREVDVDSAIDITGFRATLREAGIEDALGALLDAFATDAPARMDAIDESCRAGDADAIARAAHAFKSAAGAIAARPLAELLRQVELAGRESRVEEARNLAVGIRPAADKALEMITGLKAGAAG